MANSLLTKKFLSINNKYIYTNNKIIIINFDIYIYIYILIYFVFIGVLGGGVAQAQWLVSLPQGGCAFTI